MLVLDALLLFQQLLDVLPILACLADAHQSKKLYALFLCLFIDSHILQHPEGGFADLEGKFLGFFAGPGS